mmetsp:Transcript_28241/g.80251  ORF Transcript_28241/g.80251 Transcript_28241/m.80251 type:complete len:268 (-) Transcript_28241:12-815(-)
MSKMAPVVLRCGVIIAHINDPGTLPSVVAALAQSGVRAAPDAVPAASTATGSLECALAAHEGAMAVVRRHLGPGTTLSSAASTLTACGKKALARRLRTSARSRGALAHPDYALSEDLERVLGELRVPLVDSDPLADRMLSLERLATELSDKSAHDSFFVQKSQEKHASEMTGVKLAHASLVERVDLIERLAGDSAEKHGKELLAVKGAHAAHSRSLAEARHARASMSRRDTPRAKRPTATARTPERPGRARPARSKINYAIATAWRK